MVFAFCVSVFCVSCRASLASCPIRHSAFRIPAFSIQHSAFSICQMPRYDTRKKTYLQNEAIWHCRFKKLSDGDRRPVRRDHALRRWGRKPAV